MIEEAGVCLTPLLIYLSLVLLAASYMYEVGQIDVSKSLGLGLRVYMMGVGVS